MNDENLVRINNLKRVLREFKIKNRCVSPNYKSARHFRR